MKRFKNIQSTLVLMLVLFTGIINVSCESDDLEDPSLNNIDDELNLTVSGSNVELEENLLTS